MKFKREHKIAQSHCKNFADTNNELILVKRDGDKFLSPEKTSVKNF